MPFLDEQQTRPVGFAPTGPDNLQPEVTLGETAGAVWESFGFAPAVGRLAGDAYERRFDPTREERDYDPWGDLEGFEGYEDRFVGVRSRREVDRLKTRIRAEEAAAETVAASGAPGAAVALAIGVLDPVNLIPFGAVVKGARGASILRTAAKFSAVGAGAGAASQAVVTASQVTGDPQDILDAAMIGGALGAGLGGLMAKWMNHLPSAEVNAVVRAVRNHVYDDVAPGARALTPGETVRFERDGQVVEGVLARKVDAAEGQPAGSWVKVANDEVFVPQGETLVRAADGGSVGAAAVRKTTAAEESISGALKFQDIAGNRLKTPRVKGLIRLRTLAGAMTRNPNLALMRSPAVATRRLVQSVADIPVVLEKNKAGVGTVMSAESQARVRQASVLLAKRNRDAIFAEYRKAHARTGVGRALTSVAPVATAQAADIRGGIPGRLSYFEFKQAVADAMVNGDKATDRVPSSARSYVERAAAEARREVIEPRTKAALKAGLLSEEDLKGSLDKSYLHRMWDVPAILERPDAFRRRVVEWFRAEQETVAQKLDAYEQELEALRPKIEKIEARLDGDPKRRKKLTELLQDTKSGLSQGEIDQAKAEIESTKGLRQQAADLKALNKNYRKELVAKGRDYQAAVEAERRAKSDVEAARTARGARGQTFVKAAGAGNRDVTYGRMQEAETRLKAAEERHAQAVKTLNEAQSAFDEVRYNRVQSGAAYDGIKKQINFYEIALSQAKNRAAKLERRIESNRVFAGLESSEFDDIARQIADKITGAPTGRVLYEDITVNLRGAQLERTLDIPTELVRDFVVRDIDLVLDRYARTMDVDTLLTERFGSPNMESAFREIDAEYADLIARNPDKEAELIAERDFDKEVLGAIRDRLRGTYAVPSTSEGMMASENIERLKKVNLLTMLGGVIFSSLSDPANIILRQGTLRFFGKRLGTVVTNARALKPAVEELQKMNVALDLVVNNRFANISDVLEQARANTKVDRGLEALVNTFGMTTLIAPWNFGWRAVSGLLTQDEFIGTIQNYASASEKAKRALASAGIGEAEVDLISEQFTRHGVRQVGALKYVPTDAWTNPAAVDYFRAAVSKRVYETIIEPGQDKPLWMSRPVGSLVGQFMSFPYAAASRVTLHALQERDMATLGAVTASVSLGMVTYYVKAKLAGREVSDDPRQWVLEGLDRSGVTGWLFNLNEYASAASGGVLDLSQLAGGEPLSRFQSRNRWSVLLGPSVSTGQNLFQAAGAIGRDTAGVDEINESDARAMRRLMFYNNVPYLDWLFDNIEEGVVAGFED
jgi:predicted  nucleic acid-binding Zn-ribbon protein